MTRTGDLINVLSPRGFATEAMVSKVHADGALTVVTTDVLTVADRPCNVFRVEPVTVYRITGVEP